MIAALPRGGRAVQVHGRAPPRGSARGRARLPEHPRRDDRSARRASSPCSPRRTRPRSTSTAPTARCSGASAAAAGASRWTIFGRWGCWHDARVGSAAGGGVCARVDGRVVDMRGVDPLFDAPSLNALMAAGPEAWRQARERVDEGNEVEDFTTTPRHALRGRRLRGLLLVAPPRDEPRPDVPAGRRAAAAELAPPAGGLPRPRRHGGAERHAGAAAERPAAGPRVRAEPAARHRARGRLRDRHPEHDGRAGAGRAGARPRVRHACS